VLEEVVEEVLEEVLEDLHTCNLSVSVPEAPSSTPVADVTRPFMPPTRPLPLVRWVSPKNSPVQADKCCLACAKCRRASAILRGDALTALSSMLSIDDMECDEDPFQPIPLSKHADLPLSGSIQVWLLLGTEQAAQVDVLHFSLLTSTNDEASFKIVCCATLLAVDVVRHFCFTLSVHRFH